MSFSGREYMSETNTQRRSKNSLQSSHLHYAIPDIQIHVPDEETDANYSENSSASSETDVDSTPQSQLDSIEGNFFEESQNPIFYDDNLYNDEQENAYSSIMDLPDLNNYMVIPNVDPSKNVRSKSNSNHSVSRSNYSKATTEEGDELSQNYIHNKQPDKKSGFLSSEIPADKQRRKSVTDLAPFMQPRKSIVELTPAMQARISVFETNLGTENQILKSDDTATERRKSLIEEIPTVERRRSIRAEVLELERRYLSGDERANTDYLPETKDEIQALQRRRSIRNEILSFERRGSMQDQTIIPSRRRSRADSDENLRRKSIKTDSSEGDNEIVMRAEVLSPEKGVSIKKKILEMERRKSIKENERVSTNGYRNAPDIEIQPPDSDGEFSDTEEQYFRSVKPYLKYRKSISELEPYFLHQSEALKLSSSVQEEIARLEEESAVGEEKNFEQEHSDFKSEREYQEEFESENMNFPDSRRSSKSSATSKERHLVSRESRPVEKVSEYQQDTKYNEEKSILSSTFSYLEEQKLFENSSLSDAIYIPIDLSSGKISHISTQTNLDESTCRFDSTSNEQASYSYLQVDGDQDIIRKQLLEHQNSIAMEESEFISRRLSNDPLTYSERDISDSTINRSNRNSFSLDNVQKSSRKNSFSEEGSLKSSGLISSQGDRMQINETSTEEPSNYLTTDSNTEVNQRRKSIALEVLGFLTRRISNALETDNENQTFEKTDEQEFQEGDYKSQTSSIYNNDSKSASRKSSVIDRKLSQGSTPHEALSCSPQESISPNHDNLGTEEIVQYDQRRKSVTMEALDFMVRKFSSEPIPDHQSRRSSINPEDIEDLEETEKMQSMTVQMYNEDNRRSLSDKGSRRSSRSSVHNNHRLSRGSVTADDQYGTQKEIDYATETSRSRRSSASAEDGHRSQRGSIAFDRGSVSLEFDRKSQRNSLINEDGNRSRRSSINDNDDSVSHTGPKLVDDGQRSRKNSAVMEDERSHRGSISDSVSHRSPRGSISLHESHTPNRGSGLFDDGKISPRGSISSERNYRSRQGSTSVDEGQRSRSGSVTIQDGQRSHRNSFYEEEQAKSHDRSRKSSIDGRISPRGSISNERTYRSRQGSTSVDEGQRSRSGSVTIQDGQRSHRNSFYEEEQAKSHDRSRKSSIDGRISPRGSISNERNYRSRQGSTSVDEGQRSRSGSVTIQDGQRSHRNSFYEEEQAKSRDRSRKSSIINDTQDEMNDSLKEETQGEPRRKSIGMEVLGFIARRFSNASENEAGTTIPSITVEEHKDSQTYESPQGSRRSSFSNYHRSSVDEYQNDSQFVDEEPVNSRKSSISTKDGRRSQRGSVSAKDSQLSRKGSMVSDSGRRSSKGSIVHDGHRSHRESISAGEGEGYHNESSILREGQSSRKGSVSTNDDWRSPRGSFSIEESQKSKRGSVSDEYGRKSQRNSLINEDINRSRRSSVKDEDYSILVDEGKRSRKNSMVAEDARSHRGSISDSVSHRSPRGSISLHESHTPNRGSGLFDDGRISPRGSISSERNNRSRQGSTSVDEGQRSRSGSVTIQDGQRSHRNSFYEEEQDKSRDRSRKSSIINDTQDEINDSLKEETHGEPRRKSIGMEVLGFIARRFSNASENEAGTTIPSITVEEHKDSQTNESPQGSRRSSFSSYHRSSVDEYQNDSQLVDEEPVNSRKSSISTKDGRRSQTGSVSAEDSQLSRKGSMVSDSGRRSSKGSIVHDGHRSHRESISAGEGEGYHNESSILREGQSSRKGSVSTNDDWRSPRGSFSIEESQTSKRGSVTDEYGRKSQRNSLINEDINRSRRNSIKDEDCSILVDEGKRSRKNSMAAEDARSHRGSISDSVSHRSPRGSISLHESHTPNRGSGLFDDGRISPRGSISSERNNRSRQGSTSVDEGQRSRSGSVTIQDGQRSHRNSFYEEEQAKSRDRSRKSSVDGRISPRGSISSERNYRSRQGSTSVDEGQRSRSGSATIQDGQRSHRNSFYEEEQDKSRDRSRKSSIMNDTQDEINDSLKEETHEEPRRKSIGMEVLGFIARRFSNASENEAGTTIPSITVEEHKDGQIYKSPQGSRRSSNASFQSYHRSSADEHQRSQRDSEFVDEEAISSRKSSISSRDGRRSQRGSVSAEDGHISRKGSMSFEDGTKHHRDSIPALQEKTIDSRKSSHTPEVYNVSQFSSESDTEPNDIKYDKYKVRDSVPSETSDVILHHYIQRSFSEETPEITDYVSDSESGSELNFELALNEIESDSQSTVIINGNQVQNYKMTMQQKEILVMNKYKDEKETPDLYEALYGHIITLLTLPELGGKEHELCATFIPDVTLESSINDTEWNEISQKYKNITGFSTPGITQMSALTTLDRKGGWTTADALQNQKKRKPLDSITTVTFCGCGFLGGYLVGAATYLQERAPHLLQGRLAGSSVGSLIAACLACDVPLEYVRKNILATADVAQKYLMGPFNPFFPIEEPLLKNLLKMIPEDGHIRASGRLYLSLTRATTLTNEIVSEYSSRDELVRAILCCCFLPFISGFSVPSFNGRKYIDGGMSNNMPLKGPNTLSINAFSGEFDICPEDPEGPERPLATAFNQSIRMTNNNLTRLIHALLPPTSDVLDKHFQQGYDDAKNYFPLWNTK